jgi:hypothetical protein
MNAASHAPTPLPVDLADALDSSTSRLVHAVSEPLKRIGKATDALVDIAEVSSELVAWDRFVAALITRCPPVDSPEELTAYCEDGAKALVLRRREIFGDDGELAPPKGKTLALIESAQQLEAKFIASKGARFDLYERAKALRERADLALGIATPPPDAESPDDRNAAAARRVAQANGAVQSAPPQVVSTNGTATHTEE